MHSVEPFVPLQLWVPVTPPGGKPKGKPAKQAPVKKTPLKRAPGTKRKTG